MSNATAGPQLATLWDDTKAATMTEAEKLLYR